MTLITFTVLHNHHSYQCTKLCHCSKQKFCNCWPITSHSYSPQPLITSYLLFVYEFPFLGTYNWNPTVICPFVPCLFHLASYFQVSSMLLHVSELNLFLCLIFHHMDIPLFLFIHLLIDHWVISIFGLWWIMLLQTLALQVFIQVPAFSYFEYLWGSGIVAFWGTTKQFFLTAAPFYSPTICICVCIHICPLYIYVQGYQFFHIFTNTCHFPYFCYSHAHWYEVGSLWFWFSFP